MGPGHQLIPLIFYCLDHLLPMLPASPDVILPSPYWDAIQTSKKLALHATIYTWASSLISPGWVLDLGCEYGFGCQLIAASNPALHILGVDINSQYLVDSANLSFPELHMRLNACGTLLPIPASSLSGVFLVNLLHLVDNPSAFIAETWRILCPGGAAVFSIPVNDCGQNDQDFRDLINKVDIELRSRSARIQVPAIISGYLPNYARLTFQLAPPCSPWIAFIRKDN